MQITIYIFASQLLWSFACFRLLTGKNISTEKDAVEVTSQLVPLFFPASFLR